MVRNDIDHMRIYHDEGRNGRYDAGRDPYRIAQVEIVQVNYVALGDSYSSGEAGESPPAGEYIRGVNKADIDCRRWDLAYSQVLDARIFGEDLAVETFACTGATAKNIHSSDGSDAVTNGPSDGVAEKYAGDGVNEGWEPRQAVSLGTEDDDRSIDMVTVTIGGNDMMFAKVLEKCIKSMCDAGFLEGLYGQSLRAELGDLEDELVAVYRELKSATGVGSALDREATVFVLGYPHLVPSAALVPFYPAGGRLGKRYRTESPGCTQLTGTPTIPIVRAVPLVGPFIGSFVDINSAERRFLRGAADSLNAMIRRAAARAGVHFVDVLGVFEGHDPCSSDPWVYGLEGKPGSEFFAHSNRSFHPTEAGHAGYAGVLARYIAERQGAYFDSWDPRRSGVGLTEAGLPVNPAPVSGGQRADGTSGVVGGPGGSAEDGPEGGSVEVAVLSTSRRAPSPACRLYVPGEQLTLSAGGFAANSSVTLTAKGATAAGAALSVAQIPAVVSDREGRIETGWVVPAAPAAETDPAPRFYGVQASGAASSGGTLTAVMLQPVVAYPAAAPCAADDAASTALGQAATVAVLANDTAPPQRVAESGVGVRRTGPPRRRDGEPGRWFFDLCARCGVRRVRDDPVLGA